MKFSILLPTRNGGAFLPDVLRSVLSQSGDFELVVADNANTDDTPALLAAHVADPHLRVVRSREVSPVTENWMTALRAARGDYLLMIGDDDVLLPRFFERVDAILRRHSDPDCLTFDGYSYVAPNSLRPETSAFWSPRHFDMRRFGEREISPGERLAIVKDMFRFRVRFPLNMQLTLFSQSAKAAVPGELFRAPFPDHFALNSLLLRARRHVVTDERLLVVGVSSKSFGHYFYSGRQREGLRYLGSGSTFPGRIEGSELVNSMYAWLIMLRKAYPELASIDIDHWQYAVRQANYWYREVEFGSVPLSAMAPLVRSLKPWEVVSVLGVALGYRAQRRLRAAVAAKPHTYVQDAWPALRETSSRTIAEFAASLGPA